MSPAERAHKLDAVERRLDELGCDYKTALDHGDHGRLAEIRGELEIAGRERRRLRYSR